MKIGWTLGVVSAATAHAAFLLFGGIFFPKEDRDGGSTRTVDLLSDLEAKEEKEKPVEEREEEAREEIETDSERPPDAADSLKSLDAPVIDDAPALEAVSLSAIEAALSGQGAGGDFAEAIGFATGGRIGGTGTAKLGGETADEAFSLAEIDQKPRAIFQESPVYPAEMRSRKVEGVVSVVFVVDATGKVQNARAESSSHAAFESPALVAVRKWKFEPGVRAGQRVPSKMRISIRFPRS